MNRLGSKKAYIFDLDGTLLDSMWVWAQVDIDFLARRGFDVPADYMNAIGAMSFSEAADYTIARFGLPDAPEALMAEWSQLAQEAYSCKVPLKKGAKEYLTRLKTEGLQLAVATSCYEELYTRAFENLGLTGFFDVVCTTGQAGCSKVRPDVFLLAAERLGVKPEECAVFEDIPEAVGSAKSAGMTAYGIYDEWSRAYWQEIKVLSDGAFYDFEEVMRCHFPED